MRFLQILASTALAGLALAQEGSKIAFTSSFATAKTGEAYNITWGGGDANLPVTIALRKGDVDSIQTVQILTTNAKGGSFSWTPIKALVDGDDYTLQITQGLTDINFSGQFSISGGVDPLSASISSILASASSAIASANATISALGPITSAGAATATSTSGASGFGTGTDIPRNTTFSSASLTQTATRTSTASRTSTETAASATSSGANGANGAEGMTSRYASPMALFCAILAAIAYAI